MNWMQAIYVGFMAYLLVRGCCWSLRQPVPETDRDPQRTLDEF